MNRPKLDYSTPVTFTFRERVALTITSHVIALILRLIYCTCRLTVRNAQYREDAEAQYGAVVIAFWHEVLPLAVWRYRNSGVNTLTSYSRDGDMIARVIARFGIPAMRGSSSRGGHEALQRMTYAVQQGVTVAITPDGPRGPRRELKLGPAVVSARASAPVVPIGLAVSRCWRMNSWDRMVIPKPFARIVCEYGEAIPPSDVLDRPAVDAKRLEIEQGLNAVQERVEQETGMAL